LRGVGQESEPSSARRSFTAEDVADAFQRATGDQLRIDTYPATVSGDQDAARLGFDGPVPVAGGRVRNQPAPPQLLAKYGTFSIFVTRDPKKAKLSSFRSPDEAGRFWVKGVPERGASAGRTVWSVHKIYGANVRLSWSSDDEGRTLDERWHRLDNALSQLDEQSEGG